MMTTRNHPMRVWGCAAARGGYMMLVGQLTKPRLVAALYSLSVALGCAKVIPWREYRLTAAESKEARAILAKHGKPGDRQN